MSNCIKEWLRPLDRKTFTYRGLIDELSKVMVDHIKELHESVDIDDLWKVAKKNGWIRFVPHEHYVVDLTSRGLVDILEEELGALINQKIKLDETIKDCKEKLKQAKKQLKKGN